MSGVRTALLPCEERRTEANGDRKWLVSGGLAAAAWVLAKLLRK